GADHRDRAAARARDHRHEPLRVHPGLERVHLRARSSPVPRQGDAPAAAGAVRRRRGHRPARPPGREHAARHHCEPAPLRDHPTVADPRPALRSGEGLAGAVRSLPTIRKATPMRKLLGLGVLVLALAALATSAAQAGRTKQNVTNLTFATYVWQPT